jgi:Rps23 Pro-64 3,4-dihydroxylase Tpa1-like proline 4-hydroxylase
MNVIEAKQNSTTIPIEMDDGVFLNQKKAREFGEELSGSYCFAAPYPHIVIDNFLPTQLANEILLNFPINRNLDSEYKLNYKGIQEHKRQISPNNTNSFCRNIFGFFNSAPFLQFLEGITTIDGLISDSYFNGGGFHEISSGGKLGVHADFRINEQLHLNRRLNVLIYLNDNWQDEWGGQLEIWDKDMKNKVHSISPIFNRCVIFNTDANSYHGHPDPLNCPSDITRKSIALYYYTASKAIYEEVPSNTTMYVSRPNENTLTKRNALKLRLQNYAKDLLPPILFRKLRELKKKVN